MFKRIKKVFFWPAIMLIVSSGCIARRGADFGSYVGRGENIPIIRIFNVEQNSYPTSKQTILLLPPLGDITSKFQNSIQHDLQEEFQTYFNARITSISPQGSMAEYVTEQNLAPENGFFDYDEILRLGKLMQADFVICTWIQELRPYPPQLLALSMAVMDVNKNRLTAELDARFNASEQKVVIAMQDYLQRRIARKFDRASLDMMLSSPAAFHVFAMAETCRALALELIPSEREEFFP